MQLRTIVLKRLYFVKYNLVFLWKTFVFFVDVSVLFPTEKQLRQICPSCEYTFIIIFSYMRSMPLNKASGCCYSLPLSSSKKKFTVIVPDTFPVFSSKIPETLSMLFLSISVVINLSISFNPL